MTIEIIEIDADSDPKQLRKAFRKKAMTGGGFIALRADLTAEELQRVYQNFLPELSAGSLAERVLVALAGVKDLPAEVAAGLAGLDNSEIRRRLQKTGISAVIQATDPDEIRTIFSRSRGGDEDSVRIRMGLATSRFTPADIRAELAEDPVPGIRFHVRSR